MVVADEEGLIMHANKMTTTVFEYTKEELMGSNVTLLMPSDVAFKHNGYIKK